MTPAYPNCISVPFPVELIVSEEETKRAKEWCDDYLRQRGRDIRADLNRRIDQKIIDILTNK